MASLDWIVEDFVGNDQRVECLTQKDRMSWRQIRGSNFRSRMIGFLDSISRCGTNFSSLKFGKITVIVNLYLPVKDLGFIRSAARNEQLGYDGLY